MEAIVNLYLPTFHEEIYADHSALYNSYASAGEIRQYLKKTAEDFGLESAIKFHHEVQSAVWDEDTGLWTIEILDKKSGKLFTDQCNFFMNGSGYLKYIIHDILRAEFLRLPLS